MTQNLAELCGELRLAVFHDDAARMAELRAHPRISAATYRATVEAARSMRAGGALCSCPRCYDAKADARDHRMLAELRHTKRMLTDQKARSMLDRETFDRIWMAENEPHEPSAEPTDEPWEIDAILY